MKLKLDRHYKGTEYTIGKLYIDDVYFCDTLEDVDRGLHQDDELDLIKKTKVAGATAIPTGIYDITMNVVSPKYSDYKRYPWSLQYGGKIPRLIDVPGFLGILIHVGNKPEHTDGCILVGYNKVKGQVINSTTTFHKLMELLKEAKDKIEIEII